MHFNTKLNVGDKIWTIHPTNTTIIQLQIENIRIFYTSSAQEIIYGVNEHFFIYDSQEGQQWWRTYTELIAHLLHKTKLDSKPSGCCGHCTEVKSQTVDELCREILDSHEKKIPSSHVACQHQDLEGVLSDIHVDDFDLHFDKRLTPDEQEAIDNEFDKLFGEHVCTRPRAKSKNELNHLYEELFDRQT
jgi:hypothetical protein